MHQSEKELAQKLAAQSKGKYTTAQIEEQMRGMTANVEGKTEAGMADTVIGKKPTDSGGTWLLAGTTSDGKPIYTQQLATADASLRAYIVQNTTGSAVPSTITYAGSYNAPIYSNTAGPMATAKCASTAADCAAGIKSETQAQINDRRNSGADFFSSVGTQAGRFGAAATAYGTALANSPNPGVLAAAGAQLGLATSATFVSFGAGIMEQLLRPNPGQLATGGLADVINTGLGNKFPFAGPAINELNEAIKGSAPISDASNNVNNALGVKK